MTPRKDRMRNFKNVCWMLVRRIVHKNHGVSYRGTFSTLIKNLHVRTQTLPDFLYKLPPIRYLSTEVVGDTRGGPSRKKSCSSRAKMLR